MEYTNSFQKNVREFHEAFNHPVGDTPQTINKDRAINRCIWTGEEIVEFIHALSVNESDFTDNFLKFIGGVGDAFKKMYNTPFIVDDEITRIIALTDALADQLYFSFGTAVELGVDIEKVFDIVQASNMSKLFTDEQGAKYAKYREDGKVLKSPEFFPPEEAIQKEILRQMKLSE